MKKNNILLIYNPNAGKKRALVGKKQSITIEDIQFLLHKYLLLVDLAPTKGPGDATKIAKEAVKQKYDTVLVAGGDGTVNEAANGLVDSDVRLGIIPLGSFMNIAHMMAIPNDIEQAIQLIKINRVIKVDVGSVTHLEGDKLSKPYYFLETSGVGLDAEFQRYFDRLEKGDYSAIFPLLRVILRVKTYTTEIVTDNKTMSTKANLVVIANGPVTAAALPLAPDAKLNDRRLHVVIYHMHWWNLAKYFYDLFVYKKVNKRRIKRIETTEVKITTDQEIMVHADATLFGSTPVQYTIKPSCLNVICGFPESAREAGFIPKTYINP